MGVEGRCQDGGSLMVRLLHVKTLAGPPVTAWGVSPSTPFPCSLVAYHSLDFVASSYGLAEQSDSTVGLRFRWLIKGIYAAGLWMVVLGILIPPAIMLVVMAEMLETSAGALFLAARWEQ